MPLQVLALLQEIFLLADHRHGQVRGELVLENVALSLTIVSGVHMINLRFSGVVELRKTKAALGTGPEVKKEGSRLCCRTHNQLPLAH